MTAAESVFFPYEPPLDLNSATRAYAPNLQRAARLIALAQSPEALRQATEIYGLVLEIEVAETPISRRLPK